MKVLMFGWEFPPRHSGGLGTACQGLSEALAGLGVGVRFIMPSRLDAPPSGPLTLLGAEQFTLSAAVEPTAPVVATDESAVVPPQPVASESVASATPVAFAAPVVAVVPVLPVSPIAPGASQEDAGVAGGIATSVATVQTLDLPSAPAAASGDETPADVAAAPKASNTPNIPAPAAVAPLQLSHETLAVMLFHSPLRPYLSVTDYHEERQRERTVTSTATPAEIAPAAPATLPISGDVELPWWTATAPRRTAAAALANAVPASTTVTPSIWSRVAVHVPAVTPASAVPSPPPQRPASTPAVVGSALPPQPHGTPLGLAAAEMPPAQPPPRSPGGAARHLPPAPAAPARTYVAPPPSHAPSVLRVPTGYGQNLFAEVSRLAFLGGELGRRQDFDVIHAHDWMTFMAGVEAKLKSGRPLVLHVHSTEYDRSPDAPNRDILGIEKYGFKMADRILAVSRRTADQLTLRFDVPPERISVVHNGVKVDAHRTFRPRHKALNEKIVLFLGRITAQKGPGHFIDAAEFVLRELPGVRFVMAGAGDLLPAMIERIAERRLQHHFHFTGFLEGDDLAMMFRESDLYVMPSVSEPFGLTAVEALAHDVPVIVSSESGVREVLDDDIPQVEPGDVAGLAASMLHLLRHPELAHDIVTRSRPALERLTWTAAAEKVRAVYRDLTK